MSSTPILPEDQSIPRLDQLLVQPPEQASKYPNCFPSLNPVDIYRQHIAERLAEVTGIDSLKIYQRLAWTNALDKGDLTLPVRYRLTAGAD